MKSPSPPRQGGWYVVGEIGRAGGQAILRVLKSKEISQVKSFYK